MDRRLGQVPYAGYEADRKRAERILVILEENGGFLSVSQIARIACFSLPTTYAALATQRGNGKLRRRKEYREVGPPVWLYAVNKP